MDIYDRMDPELAAVHRNLPAGSLNFDDLAKTRALVDAMAELGRMRADMPVTIEDRIIPGVKDHPELRVRLYRPTAIAGPLAGLLWIHGGGYVIGTADMSDQRQAEMAIAGQCLVVSVDYRLAPETPFPGPLDDCYAALKWLAANAAELGVDASRIAIGGASAGGGLAAGLALLARDRDEVKVIFQLLIYPMIDDRNVTASSHFITMEKFWNRALNLRGWAQYLGKPGGSADVSPYAAASRATDLQGLPPAYIPVGDLDLFVDENIEYAQRLLQAGVPTELHIYTGAYHGSESMVPSAKISQRCLRGIDDALRRALAKPE
ncbi:MAG: alpha/beta hydrolase [Spongiibacteraceae bacterium]